MEKIQTIGLKGRYNNDQGFILYMRMISALAFFPTDSAANVFERMCDVIRNTCSIAADEVLDYFQDTYIDRFCRN